MKVWTVFYFTMRPHGHLLGGDKWIKNVVGEVEADTMEEAIDEARAEFGSYQEVGYRLRVERQRVTT
jgi:hypothetical protein